MLLQHVAVHISDVGKQFTTGQETVGVGDILVKRCFPLARRGAGAALIRGSHDEVCGDTVQMDSILLVC